MSHTAEQEKIVLKVLSHRPHEFYEILEVSKTSNENEIKRSYRKLAIKLHPDKNPHPRAAEAFKVINKAWEVLSDPQKKRIFDQTGSDPDTRFNPSMSSTSARTGTHGAFNQNADFDDIFDFFFGGPATRGAGAGGSPFGGGPQTFSFGNNGFTFHSFGGPGAGFQSFPQQRQRQRQRPATNSNENGDLLTNLKQLLPILLFVLISILPSLFGESSVPDYSFRQTTKFDLQRQTPNLKIPFYVSGNYINKKKYSDSQMKSFDAKIENLYVQDKRSKCSKEQIHKNELFEDAHGWFSINERKLQQAQNYPMPNCEFLKQHNLI